MAAFALNAESTPAFDFLNQIDVLQLDLYLFRRFEDPVDQLFP